VFDAAEVLWTVDGSRLGAPAVSAGIFTGSL